MATDDKETTMSHHEAPRPYQQLHQQLLSVIAPSRIITNPDLCLAYGTDASFYRLIPKMVVRLKNIQEVIFCLKSCHQLNVAVTFRAAGTSLSGQAISDSVLITLTDDWREHRVLEQGRKIRLQPGVIGADANRYLAPYQRKIGPDPASINSCKIGGIAANNASGMCCGTAHNTYKTVESMKIVFSDGSLLDTGDSESILDFKQQHPHFIEQLETLCDETLDDPELCQRIFHKYRLKNTTGYALNALVDYQTPIEVIEHLMVGSEGTLGFIAEITYNTIEDCPHKATSLMVFNDIETASQAVTALASTPISAVELMDGRSLRSIAHQPNMPEFIASLDIDACALLIDVQGSNCDELTQHCDKVTKALQAFELKASVPFTQDADVIQHLWNIRKGLFPAVGAVRDTGTTVIIEDVAFPVDKLAQGTRELQQLLTQHGYDEAIIFGHALDGNLHFVFTQSFALASEVERYNAFMTDLSQLVAVKYQGSLKAEHGTGRNMAPYVELEWGPQGYALMQKIKTLFDPKGILNPGVLINADPTCHLKHLKPIPPANPLIDACIECGFCEPVCPSRTLSLSPRQRIVLHRERQHRVHMQQSVQDLDALFQYQGIDTCAATGLCAERCPVNINTGDLIKQLRAQTAPKNGVIARWSAKHFSAVTRLAKIGLSTQYQINKWGSDQTLYKWSLALRKRTQDQTPIWFADLPKGNHFALVSEPETPANSTHRKVVYMPSCSSRVMGNHRQQKDTRSLTEVTLSVLKKAGFDVIIPRDVDQLCCGMPFDSKGKQDLASDKAQQLQKALWQASRQGEYPVLIDTSPCVKHSLEQFSKSMKIYEPTQFTCEYLLPLLDIEPIEETVMLHVTCSSQKMGLETSMLALAKRCAQEVIIPEHITCCGWAGDKGLITPELNAAALSPLKHQIPKQVTRGFSNSLTCELGLSHHSGICYQSILYLVDEATKTKVTTSP
ncbi:FAD-binding and (Fe-S)-binding domain-containing protein [Vibrio sp. AK197]